MNKEPLEIGTRVQQLGDDCEAGYLCYGKILEIKPGPFGKGYIYNIKLDNGGISTDVLRCEMRLETDPPYKQQFIHLIPLNIPLKTSLSQYSVEELEEELKKRL